jgi:hypothetical protein
MDGGTLLIDGIPESIVIGSGIMGLVAGRLAESGVVNFADVVPYTLISGLFLSNFPEALSSSVALRAQGYRPVRVLAMWLVLLVITAVGAGIGYLIGDLVPHVALAAVEGLAAGAMLTTIASTMIPEAVHLSGSSSRAGLATLAGFLAAVAFKLLESAGPGTQRIGSERQQGRTSEPLRVVRCTHRAGGSVGG